MTQPASVPLGEMVQQSIKVLTKPSVQTFEEFENRGLQRDALIYVAIGAAITGLLALPGGLLPAIGSVISTVVGFFVFTYVVHYVGKTQGGTGSLDQVAYTFSLFWIPLQILASLVGLILVISLVGILLLPLLPFAALAASVYFAYLAAQSSLNLTDTTKLVIALLAGIVAAAIAGGILNAIFRAG
jgi:hypothetical protein